MKPRSLVRWLSKLGVAALLMVQAASDRIGVISGHLQCKMACPLYPQ